MEFIVFYAVMTLVAVTCDRMTCRYRRSAVVLVRP